MLSNDILRSLRYTLKANNNDMVRILALSDMEATSAGFDTWMTKEDEEGFVRCPDIILSGFLNGLIYDKRGKDDERDFRRQAFHGHRQFDPVIFTGKPRYERAYGCKGTAVQCNAAQKSRYPGAYRRQT